MNKFICHICGKMLSQSGTCKRHIVTAHESKVFPCPKCKRQYTRKETQKTHTEKCTYVADSASSQTQEFPGPSNAASESSLDNKKKAGPSNGTSKRSLEVATPAPLKRRCIDRDDLQAPYILGKLHDQTFLHRHWRSIHNHMLESDILDTINFTLDTLNTYTSYVTDCWRASNHVAS